MAVRRCEFCSAELPKGSRSNRKFCDDDCRRGRTKGPTVEELFDLGDIVAETEKSIAEAKAANRLGPLDAGPIAALRVLAQKIGDEQARWDYAIEWAQLNPGERGGPRPPAHDNVSIPTYLKACDSLGLTPAGRGRIGGEVSKPKDGEDDGVSVDGLAAEVPRPG